VIGIRTAIRSMPAPSDSCDSARIGLESKDASVFRQALQATLDYECQELLPRIALLFESGNCPARFRAADALALSGEKRYGPLLMRYYLKATAGLEDFDAGNLIDNIVLACSDLPRGRNLSRVERYASSPPRLSKDCVTEYRKFQEGMHDERVLEGMIGLLERSATPEGIDIAEAAYSSSDLSLRDGAVFALQHLSLDMSLHLFTRAINDPYSEVRFQVVRILQEKSDPRVRLLLLRRRRVVRRAAVVARDGRLQLREPVAAPLLSSLSKR